MEIKLKELKSILKNNTLKKTLLLNKRLRNLFKVNLEIWRKTSLYQKGFFGVLYLVSPELT